MLGHTLYAYVDGNDLHDVAPRIREELERFVGSERWTRPTWIVDQMQPRAASMRTDDLTDWDLGLNHELPALGSEADGWFSDVERIAVRLDELAASTEREFVVGLVNNQTGVSEDICYLDGGGVDMDELRAMFRGLPPPMEAS